MKVVIAYRDDGRITKASFPVECHAEVEGGALGGGKLIVTRPDGSVALEVFASDIVDIRTEE